MRKNCPVRKIVFALDRESDSERRVASGALRYAACKPDWDITLVNLRHGESLNSLVSRARRRRFDGMLCGSQLMELPDGLRNRAPIPTVFASVPQTWTSGGGISTIDNHAIASAAAGLLADRGYANFAYVGSGAGEFTRQHSDDRMRAFSKCVRDRGFDVAFAEVGARLDRFLSQLPKPVGIMAYNDAVAKTVLDACHGLELDVPGQVGVCGVDNDPDVCENARPTLTSVIPDFEAGGYAAAMLLDRMLTGKEKRGLVSYGIKGIAERNSTLVQKTGARVIASALRIIKARFSEKLSVQAIARDLNVSASTLHLRFRQIVGSTVHQEIERIRLEHANALLRKTDQTIRQIALACGFPSPEHFQRLYKRRFGVTPGRSARR